MFGATDTCPYAAAIAGNHLARFIRVRLNGHDCLHFNECEVFGERPDPATRELVLEEAARARHERWRVPVERNGHLTEIGGFVVFVDTERYAADIISALDGGEYERRERQLVAALVQPGDRIIEAGTAIGVVSMTAAMIVGAQNVLTFDANPDIVADARENFRRNGLSGIKSRIGALKNRQSATSRADTVDFHISREYWASRLNASPTDPGIIKTVQVPVFCLEKEIKLHGANVLICNIEGGETDLLMRADLSGIRTIIMETHYWSAGELAIDAMVRKLILAGFAIHLGHSGRELLVLRRRA